MGRLGTPEDIGNVVVLLCCEQAAWITGQTIYADGRNVQELKSSMIRSRGMSVLAPPGLPHTGDISP